MNIYLHKVSILPIYELLSEGSVVFSTENDYNVWSEGMYPPEILNLTTEDRQILDTELSENMTSELLILSFELFKSQG